MAPFLQVHICPTGNSFSFHWLTEMQTHFLKAELFLYSATSRGSSTHTLIFKLLCLGVKDIFYVP